MARAESEPILYWQTIHSSTGDYSQLRLRGLLGNERVRDKLFNSSLPRNHKLRTEDILDDNEGRIMNLLRLGGVATIRGGLHLGLPSSLDQTNPDVSHLIEEEMILSKTDLEGYGWDALSVFASEDKVNPSERFVVVKDRAEKSFFHNGKDIFLNVGSSLKAVGKPRSLARIFRFSIIQAYRRAGIPMYIAPQMMVKQTLFDICKEFGLGYQPDLYKDILRNSKGLQDENNEDFDADANFGPNDELI